MQSFLKLNTEKVRGTCSILFEFCLQGWNRSSRPFPSGCLQCFAQALVLLPSSPSTSTAGLRALSPWHQHSLGGWGGTEGSRVRAALPRLEGEGEASVAHLR